MALGGRLSTFIVLCAAEAPLRRLGSVAMRSASFTLTVQEPRYKGKTMKLEITNKLLQKTMCLFFVLGAASHGCIFVTYVLWWLGRVE
jgi:hypothetical protein